MKRQPFPTMASILAIFALMTSVMSLTGFEEFEETRYLVPFPLGRLLYHNVRETLFMVPWHLSEQEQQPRELILASPDGQYGLYMKGQTDEWRCISLCDLPDQKHTRMLLCNTRYFGAVWSWNSRAFAVNNEFATGGCEPHLFRIEGKAMDCFTVEHVDLSTTTMAYLPQLTQGREYMKNWIGAIEWSQDGSQLLMYYKSHYPLTLPANGEPMYDEGYFTCDLSAFEFFPGRTRFRSAIPEVDTGAEPLATAIDRRAAEVGRKKSTNVPTAVLAWRTDRKAFILAVPTYASRPYMLRELILLYDTEKGNVERVEWIPKGWVSRCNYLEFTPKGGASVGVR